MSLEVLVWGRDSEVMRRGSLQTAHMRWGGPCTAHRLVIPHCLQCIYTSHVFFQILPSLPPSTSSILEASRYRDKKSGPRAADHAHAYSWSGGRGFYAAAACLVGGYEMLEGPARKVSSANREEPCVNRLLYKVSLVLVFLSACGWVVFVTGFGIRNSE